MCNRWKLKRGDSVLQETGRRASFLCKCCQHSCLWSGGEGLFIIWISDTHDFVRRPDHCGIASKREPTFFLFLFHYFSSGLSLQLFPPLAHVYQNLCKCWDMFIGFIFLCVCGCLSPLVCVCGHLGLAVAVKQTTRRIKYLFSMPELCQCLWALCKQHFCNSFDKLSVCLLYLMVFMAIACFSFKKKNKRKQAIALKTGHVAKTGTAFHFYTFVFMAV